MEKQEKEGRCRKNEKGRRRGAEEEEGSKQPYERNVLETAEGPFWDLSLRNCPSGDGDGSAAVSQCDGENMFSVLWEESAGVEIWRWDFGTTKHLVCVI